MEATSNSAHKRCLDTRARRSSEPHQGIWSSSSVTRGQSLRWILPCFLYQSEFISVPWPATASLDKFSKLPIGEMKDGRRNAPPPNTALVFCQFFLGDIAPAKRGPHLLVAAEEQPGTDPCLPIRGYEVHGPIAGHHVAQDARHEHNPTAKADNWR
jgi:hypothetical protein